jgi:hypothetical protein
VLVAARDSALLQSRLSPIDYLCSVYQNENEPTNVRVEAARTICQYIYPKLQSVDVNGRADLPDERPPVPMIEMAAEGAVTDAVAAPVATALSDEDEADR